MWIYEKSQVVKLEVPSSTCRQEGTEIVAAFPAMSDIRMTWRDRNPAALPQIPQGAAVLINIGLHVPPSPRVAPTSEESIHTAW